MLVSARVEGWKCSLPWSSGFAGDGGQHGDQTRQRIVGQMRIGGVALTADHGERRVQAAAPADLDHLAQFQRIGRLADQAEIELLAMGGEQAQHRLRAVERAAFLVAGDQQADRALAACPASEARHRGDEAGDRALHVGGAPAIEVPVDHRAVEGLDRPALSDRHHVGMAGEAEIGARVPSRA